MKALKPAKTIHGVQIERGIPVPQGANGYRREVLEAMSSGDSIVVTFLDREAWRRTALHMGLHVCTRSLEGGNVRLWRVDCPAKAGRPSTFLKEKLK
jgi:hypothetical protein